MDPDDRRVRAQIGAHSSWAHTPDRSARTAPARAAMLEKFARQVDPEGTMTPAARALAADSARKAHLLRMTRASIEARRKARQLLAQAEAADAELQSMRDAG
jgi:hypothetical protein